MVRSRSDGVCAARRARCGAVAPSAAPGIAVVVGRAIIPDKIAFLAAVAASTVAIIIADGDPAGAEVISNASSNVVDDATSAVSDRVAAIAKAATLAFDEAAIHIIVGRI